MDALTTAIIKELQGNLPLTENPYATIAEKLSITEAALVEILQGLKAKGQLKRIGAILKHQKSGYNANAMAVFQIDKTSTKAAIETLGRALAESPKVSHCYERAAHPIWPYHLYAMVHGKTKDEVKSFIKDFAENNNIRFYDMLFSEEELKKTSMVYVK